MARRGLFGTNTPSGNVAGSVIKNILQMQGTGDTAAEPGTTDGTSPVKKTPEQRKASRAARQFTPEQIAKDPVLSGSLSYDQARVNYIKYTRALNKMPLATTTGKRYKKQLAEANAAIAKLGGNPQEIERQFFALGGKLTGVGKTAGNNAGMRASDILDYWTAAGMRDKGLEIVAKIRGYDQYGNDIAGGIDKSKEINYTFGPEMQTRMKSPTKGLNTLQAARLTKLRNLKQGGATLGPKQLANIKRLRALAKG